MSQAYGWSGTAAEFLETSLASWLTALRERHSTAFLGVPSASQDTAWQNCHRALTATLQDLINQSPPVGDWTMVFEYELPRERGRRPDVVILAESVIIVLEFKDFATALSAHLDQAAAYARDLRCYHAGSHRHPVVPVLVLTKSSAVPIDRGPEGVLITAPRDLSAIIRSIVCRSQGPRIRPAAWLAADYAPLPSLVSAARAIFQNEPLPRIRRAQSAGIPRAIAELVAIGKRALAAEELHLALVTGVPGAGKTLTGLQLVHANHFGDRGSQRSAVFLSGNGPLVNVLQHALKSGIFVQDVHGFLRQYGGDQSRLPAEYIWVYDEAQRAWDAERVREKRGHGTSEPEDFLRLGARKEAGALMVGLIGEGQEIHRGEETGLSQWNDAMAASGQSWIIHCPGKVAHLFPAARSVQPSDALDLTRSLRSHSAEEVHLWVQQLLAGDFGSACQTARRVEAQRFAMYLCRDRALAEGYVRQRYAGAEDKRYGLLASSRARNLERHGVPNSYRSTKYFRQGPWYNDPPSSPDSCCALRKVATEFSCQGLELDFPIIAWGNDLTWNGQQWQSAPQLRSRARDPHRLRLNSYRVLLTRGRDGFIIYVPDEPAMDSTAAALREAGISNLG